MDPNQSMRLLIEKLSNLIEEGKRAQAAIGRAQVLTQSVADPTGTPIQASLEELKGSVESAVEGLRERLRRLDDVLQEFKPR